MMKLFEPDSNSIPLSSPQHDNHSPIRNIEDPISIQPFSPEPAQLAAIITEKPLSNIK